MKTIYTFLVSFEDSWNPATDSYDSKVVEVSMSTAAKADEARALLIMEGFACTPVDQREAHTDVSEAVALTKRIFAAK